MLFLFFNVHAAPLEVKLPDIPGIQAPNNTDVPISHFFKYFYNLSIIIAGLLATTMIIWGGIKYILSRENPTKLKDARDQIGMAFLGLILIFGSWMLVNTINPDLTSLSSLMLVDENGNPMKFPNSIDSMRLGKAWNKVASNKGLPTPDGLLVPPTPKELPRIVLHEIPIGKLITSEFRVSEFIRDFDTDLETDIDYADDDIIWPPEIPDEGRYSTNFQGALYGARLKRIQEVAETAFTVLTKLEEETEDLIDIIDECRCNDNCDVESSACTVEGGKCSCDSSQNPCSDETVEKIEEQKDTSRHFTNAFKKFLNQGQLVQDYYDSNQSEIDGIDDDEVKEAIELMIEVENKGEFSPSSDPLERDVGSNLSEIYILLVSMKNAKKMSNPYDSERGFLGLFTFSSKNSLLAEMDAENSTVTQWRIPFITEPFFKVDSDGDPATFYSLSNSPLSQKEKNNNIVYAGSDDPEFDPNDPYSQGTTCAQITEIPIGTAFDEAIQLTQDIQNQLLNVYLYGYAGVLKSELAIMNSNITKELTCKTGCFSPFCITYAPLGIPLSQCAYIPPITAIHCRGLLIPAMVLGMRTADNIIDDGVLGQMEKAYKKLDSQEPIGTEYYCDEPNGDCRDSKNKLIKSKIKERRYTLKQKLTEVQLLLNKSRELTNDEGGKSIYKLLLEDYVDLNLYDELDLSFDPQIEIDYIDNISTGRVDLQNCDVFFDTKNVTEQQASDKELLNCLTAENSKAVDQYDRTICNPDPYLDKGYFYSGSSRDPEPMSCYCHNEDTEAFYYDQKKFPELYSTSLDINVPDINSSIADLYSTGDYFFYDAGQVDIGYIDHVDDIYNIDLPDIPDVEDIASDFDPQELYNSLMKSRVNFNEFIGFGNNYYCCVKSDD